MTEAPSPVPAASPAATDDPGVVADRPTGPARGSGTEVGGPLVPDP